MERFTYDRNNFNGVAPGQYDNSNTSFNKSNYNRNQKGYVGSKEARFDDPIIRPHLGPGSYETNYDTIR